MKLCICRDIADIRLKSYLSDIFFEIAQDHGEDKARQILEDEYLHGRGAAAHRWDLTDTLRMQDHNKPCGTCREDTKNIISTHLTELVDSAHI